MAKREVVVRETHRGLLFRDGALVRELGPGRHPLAPEQQGRWRRGPVEDVTLIDVRERELTIKGQEILTADKVAIRVTIITKPWPSELYHNGHGDDRQGRPGPR